MNKRNGFLVVLVALMVLSMGLTGCVTASSIGGASEGHGFFSGGGAKEAVTNGYSQIAEFSVILGLFDAGFDEYAKAVQAACAEGKQVTSTTTWIFGIITKYTAYAK